MSARCLSVLFRGAATRCAAGAASFSGRGAGAARGFAAEAMAKTEAASLPACRPLFPPPWLPVGARAFRVHSTVPSIIKQSARAVVPSLTGRTSIQLKAIWSRHRALLLGVAAAAGVLGLWRLTWGVASAMVAFEQGESESSTRAGGVGIAPGFDGAREVGSCRLCRARSVRRSPETLDTPPDSHLPTRSSAPSDRPPP